MLFVVKDIKINGVWNTIGTLSIKEDSILYPLLIKNGKGFYSTRGLTKIGKIFYLFYKPKRAIFVRSGILSYLYQNYHDTIKLLGCFPFDFPDVIQEKEDMKDLYIKYGIEDFRIIVWRI